eukprot:CAMPEP_0183711092 /NCGR_PEP_ID=MMETSP0737-20130205/6676_1 /TAXON_ID=385413 /ORGANISM="Thalassiosira miniscula, Strain CCMP1093" /LENGTH=152 /DNA_ID=CAMNT_0025939513 /DNA_START=132 /DNA_END=590 /DNA_ORIENTATION=+
MTRSAPISFPTTHIHRTPSELQLIADTKIAEYKDVAMYSRLIVGMYNQAQHRSLASGTEDVGIHPLSERSMLSIVKTKQANENELDHPDDGNDWDMTYFSFYDDDESNNCSILSSQEEITPSRTNSKESFAPSLPDTEDSDIVEDGLFCLEM